MKKDKNIEVILRQTAKKLADLASNKAFEMYQRKDFRLYIEFENISQTEQDRIFNELEVSCLGLFVLFFDHVIRESTNEKKIVMEGIRSELPFAFLDILAELGIEKKYLTIWQKLMDMRFKEYRRDYKMMVKEFAKDKQFQEDRDFLSTFSRIQTITYDCVTHISRQKFDTNDPLWKLMRKWFITFEEFLLPFGQLGEKIVEKN